jgi:hypothetical protein
MQASQCQAKPFRSNLHTVRIHAAFCEEIRLKVTKTLVTSGQILATGGKSARWNEQIVSIPRACAGRFRRDGCRRLMNG